VVIIVYNGVTYTIAKESSSPVIDTGNLIGMWYWVKSEKSDGSGGWENQSRHERTRLLVLL